MDASVSEVRQEARGSFRLLSDFRAFHRVCVCVCVSMHHCDFTIKSAA